MNENQKETRIPDAQSADCALYPDAISELSQWLEIKTIDDIRPHIRPNDGIYFFEDDDFIVCRYTSALPTTFQSAEDLECRCMIFSRKTGELLSRTFHKFFNLGERQSLHQIDLSQGAWLENKLDGSMIGAFIWKGQVIYHTRGGLSDQARAAGRHASRGHDDLVHEAFDLGFTPVFEYTSPENRVVISYRTPAMTLLALRNRTTGEYDIALRDALAMRHGVPIPDALSGKITTRAEMLNALADLKDRCDIEGAVIVLPSGHRLKVKTDDYLRRHRILGNIDKEKYVYLCYLEDLLDDTSAALGGERGRVLGDFVSRIDERITKICQELSAEAGPLSTLPKKDRALKIKETWAGILQAGAFLAANGQDPKPRILEVMARQIRQEEKREILKRDLGLPSWTVDIHALR
jgi:RNA ligase